MITRTRDRGALAPLVSLALILIVIGGASHVQSVSRETTKPPIIDSNMSKKEAFAGLDPQCPDSIRKRQSLVAVNYYSTDQQIHQGQLVIDAELKPDIEKIFKLALKEHFPIYSVIPISDMRFRKDNRWDDELSMEANNTSAFNYREVTGGGGLSQHAYGRAIDINTFLNPYIKGNIILPHGSTYDPKVAGTFTPNNSIVREFLRVGWNWGGNWTSPTDYQHFEKPLKDKDLRVVP